MISRKRHLLTGWLLAVSSGLAMANHCQADYSYDAVQVDPPVQPVVIDDEASQSDLPAPAAMEAPVAATAPCKCCNSTCCTKKKREATTAAMKGAYKGVFYANDFSYLNNPCYNGPSFLGDSLKGLCCGKLDIGGEARVRFQGEDNIRGLGLTGRDDSFWLTRVRLFADYRMNEYFRLYGEYLYADSGGENFNNRPIEENRGEVQNLFLDAALTSSLTLRVGRQELLYGAQRLVSPLDWANTRRSFEGVKGMYKGDDWTVDAFFTHPLNRIAANESKIDDANEDVDFYGVWATKSGTSVGNLDAFYLGLNNDIIGFDYQTIGTRVWGESHNGVLYEFEGGYQFGNNAPGLGNHNAGFFTGGLGHQFNSHCNGWKPTIWLWYDWASGDDNFQTNPALARGDNGFDQLYPLAHKYLGFMDLFGRRNINDVNAQFIAPIGKSNVKFLLWYHYFFLDQKTTPYSVVMTPYNTTAPAVDRELGQEIDLMLSVPINPRNSLLIGYSFFDAGKYYDTPGVQSDADAQFFWTQYQMRF
jgi:hypothetical protein